jgi:hypothetical protein
VASALPDPDTETTFQALAQEQALFNRKMEEHDALFRLQLAMGWSTFLLVPATVIAVIVYPPAAAGMVPLTGLAAWNWRRMLRRDSGEIEVMTKPSANSE